VAAHKSGSGSVSHFPIVRFATPAETTLKPEGLPSFTAPLAAGEFGHMVGDGFAGCRPDNAFEAFQPFSEAALTECPQCKGEIRKVYSTVGVVFKGSGFYKTDSAVKPAATSEKSE